MDNIFEDEHLKRRAWYRVMDPAYAPLRLRRMVKNARGKRVLAARWTGEKRNPREGEFYLSGAVPGAWCARNDLSAKYAIAELAVLQVKTVAERIDDDAEKGKT